MKRLVLCLFIAAMGCATHRPVHGTGSVHLLTTEGGFWVIRDDDGTTYDNAFKVQWELFLKHVAADEPFRWTLREGAKGVQLAELGMKSWKERRWVEVTS